MENTSEIKMSMVSWNGLPNTMSDGDATIAAIHMHKAEQGASWLHDALEMVLSNMILFVPLALFLVWFITMLFSGRFNGVFKWLRGLVIAEHDTRTDEEKMLEEMGLSAVGKFDKHRSRSTNLNNCNGCGSNSWRAGKCTYCGSTKY